jgi:hypothetical protein
MRRKAATVRQHGRRRCAPDDLGLGMRRPRLGPWEVEEAMGGRGRRACARVGGGAGLEVDGFSAGSFIPVANSNLYGARN